MVEEEDEGNMSAVANGDGDEAAAILLRRGIY